MTVFFVSSSNTAPENIKGLEDAFNQSAQIESFQEVSDNAWLVDAKAGVSAKDLSSLITENTSGQPVQNAVVELNGENQTFVVCKDPQAVNDWVKSRGTITPPKKVKPLHWKLP